MSTALTSILAFIVAIGVLVTVHEFGHFWVARRLGVKVLRFSLGFGRPLWSKRAGADATEYVIAAIPLGGYVKMLDEHEGAVAPAELARAFNRKPLSTRFAIVSAGPLFNLLFAIIAYWLVLMTGVSGTRPLLGEILPHSPAAEAGLTAGDEIEAVEGRVTPTWESVILALLNSSMDNASITLKVRGADGGISYRDVVINTEKILDTPDNILEVIGLSVWQPKIAPIIDRLEPDAAAARAGLLPGDEITVIDAQPIRDWDEVVTVVRAHPGTVLRVEIKRGAERKTLMLRPERVSVDGTVIGRIGAMPKVPDKILEEMRVEHRYGPLEGFTGAVRKTYDMSLLTLRLLGKMLIGEASVKNVTGPISIAQYAGHSAGAGISVFLSFLALVSISLGVLNLLPVPLLDGGHLMYYIVEWIKGSPVSDHAQVIGQKVGIALLAALMGLAFYNDFARLLT